MGRLAQAPGKRGDGPAHHPGDLRVELEEIAAFFRSENERAADPRLSALSGPDIHLLEGSPALGNGKRLANMDERDLYGLPVGEEGAVNIGASLRKPGAGS